jgi:CelD/BcsL family acetyltransferase involved in cellulose biosynthesis
MIARTVTIRHQPDRAVASAPSMEWRIDRHPAPDVEADIAALWSADPHASPFASAAFLLQRARYAEGAGSTPVLVRGLVDQRTVALWPLVLDKAGRIGFLQEGDHSDHCTCLAASSLDEASLGVGLAHAINLLRPREVSFNNVPPWGLTLASIKVGLEQSGWRSRAFSATPCPVVRKPPGPGAANELLKEFNRHSRLRTKENRLKRMPGFAFEALEDGDDLETWAREFADVHEWRWNRTRTPSLYRDSRTRGVFLDHLRAWSRDRVLRRFAIRLNRQRYAFAACLTGGDRLVYYQLANVPAFRELSLGKLLVRSTGAWMCHNGFLTLDFGVGDEEYKHDFATQTDMLWKVYAAPRSTSVLLARAAVQEHIRHTPAARKVWTRCVNDLVRGRLIAAASDARAAVQRFRATRTQEWNSFARSRALGRTAPSNRTYGGVGKSGVIDPNVVSLDTTELLKLTDARRPAPPANRACAIERYYNGARPVALLGDGRPVMAVWLVPPDASRPAIDDPLCWRIEPLVFLRGSRTPGVLARLLSGCLGMVPSRAPVLLTAPKNSLLRRELASAGFESVDAQQIPLLITPLTETASQD